MLQQNIIFNVNLEKALVITTNNNNLLIMTALIFKLPSFKYQKLNKPDSANEEHQEESGIPVPGFIGTPVKTVLSLLMTII